MRPEERSASTRAAARVAAYGGLLFFGTSLLGAVLANMPLAALVAQAVAAEWGMGRLGLSWSDPLAPEPTGRDIATRMGKGALLGVVPAAVVLEWLHLTHNVDILPPSFAWSSLGLGLLSATLTAVRDQILLVGLSRRVLIHLDRALPRMLAAGALFAARSYSQENATAPDVAASFCFGAFAAAIFQRDRSAYGAVGMNVGWLLCTDTLFHGALLDARPLPSLLSGGDAGMGKGVAAAIVLGLAAIAAWRAPRSASTGAPAKTPDGAR